MGAIESFLRTINEALQPDEQIGVADWAAKYRVLPPSSPEPGKWRNERTPYLVGVMDALSGMPSPTTRASHDDPTPLDNGWVKIVAQQKGHQLGGSACGENFIGRSITSAAGNILAVFATEADAEKWEIDRFVPMRDSTAELRKRVKRAGEKGSDNTKLRKKFPGGMINLVTSLAAGRLKSTTVRYVLAEEIDEWPMNVDGQGNPFDLAVNRTSNFGSRAKIFANSTPTIDGKSQIQRLHDQGDQRKYFARCPHCSLPQAFDWRNMKWEDGAPETVLLFCTVCSAGSPEHAWKTRGYDGAYWMPTAPGDGKTASFHLSSLYAPLGWRPWVELVRDWLDAQGDVLKMIRFINNELAQCWKDKSVEAKWQLIKARAWPYKSRQVPRGALVLTCSVDTQNDRLEVLVIGWGRGMTVSTIEHVILHGDPALQQVWSDLDAYRAKPFVNADGQQMRIQLCGIDSGGSRTNDVYDYVRTRQHEGVFALKGTSQKHRPVIGRPTDQDVTVKGRTIKKGVKLWPIGTDTAKDRIFGALAADGEEGVDPAAYRMRFPDDLDDEHYEQLTGEIYNPAKDVWVKIRPRQEVLDLHVYNLACAYHPRLRLNRFTEADWAALESLLEPHTQDMFAAAAAITPAPAVPAEPVRVAVTETRGEAVLEVTSATAAPDDSDNWLGVDDGWLD